jgi:hypothetical protein
VGKRWVASRTGLKGRVRGFEGFGFLFFFSNLFLIKPFSKLNSFQTLNTSNSFQNFQIILKTFKTSHHHIYTPCKQKMMLKHLLLLKLFKSDI